MTDCNETHLQIHVICLSYRLSLDIVVINVALFHKDYVYIRCHNGRHCPLMEHNPEKLEGMYMYHFCVREL